jgi:hypothetical protein
MHRSYSVRNVAGYWIGVAYVETELSIVSDTDAKSRRMNRRQAMSAAMVRRPEGEAQSSLMDRVPKDAESESQSDSQNACPLKTQSTVRFVVEPLNPVAQNAVRSTDGWDSDKPEDMYMCKMRGR